MWAPVTPCNLSDGLAQGDRGHWQVVVSTIGKEDFASLLRDPEASGITCLERDLPVPGSPKGVEHCLLDRALPREEKDRAIPMTRAYTRTVVGTRMNPICGRRPASGTRKARSRGPFV